MNTNTPENRKLLEKAIQIATYHHGQQLDKTDHLYILHPLTVMGMMDIDDYEGKIVAVLHDVVEDTECTLEMMAQWLPQHLVDAIDAITMRKGEPREVYRDYITRCAKNSIAARVKINDVKHNASPERSKGVKRSDNYQQRVIDTICTLHKGCE